MKRYSSHAIMMNSDPDIYGNLKDLEPTKSGYWVKFSDLKGINVTKKALTAAQESYTGNEEYGLTDKDMKIAIQTAFKEIFKDAL